MCHWVICPGEHHPHEIGSSYAQVSHMLSHASSPNSFPPLLYIHSPLFHLLFSTYWPDCRCFTLSAVTINPYTWCHKTHCLGSVTTKPKIYSVLMPSNCFFTGVSTQRSFTGVVTLPFRLLCHMHVSLFFCLYLPPGNELLSLKLKASKWLHRFKSALSFIRWSLHKRQLCGAEVPLRPPLSPHR